MCDSYIAAAALAAGLYGIGKENKMDSPNDDGVLQTPEMLRLNEQLLALQQELDHCQAARKAAHTAELHFQTFSENVQDYAFISFDPQSRIVSWSRGAERILGYSAQEALGQPGSMIFTPEDRANGEAETELATALRDGCAEDDRWHLRRDGARFWASGIMTAHRDKQGNLQGYSKVMRDVTSRKLLQDRLEESEERFRLFSENVGDYALVPVDTAGNVSGWNSGAERTFGYTEQEILGRPVRLFFTPEDREKEESEKDLARALAEGRAEDSRWMIRRDGSRFWARWITTPMYDATGRLRGFAKVLRNETERKESDDLMSESLQQKDLLLREIHHRVKNHLQVISSLLSLQAGQVNDDKFKGLLDELQDRVRAIAALHETLYGSRDLANIDFGPYMRQLLLELFGFHGVDRERIQVRAKSDDVVLSIEQALPLGLIVNELVSNSLKHAFPGQRRGTIEIQFRYLAGTVPEGKTLDQAWCELSVQDNGVGIDNAADIWHRKSMGLRIVQLFTKQLGGEVNLEPGHSAHFCLRFPQQQFESMAART